MTFLSYLYKIILHTKNIKPMNLKFLTIPRQKNNLSKIFVKQSENLRIEVNV